ncbi:MAG: peptidyl-prolyl cis-trans isomerase [Candidatus Coatesbacteria bacterium]|nr:peptidyl-prolyl cis-trans isomerase [Candidatus Coatesbacteria bacterium]
MVFHKTSRSILIASLALSFAIAVLSADSEEGKPATKEDQKVLARVGEDVLLLSDFQKSIEALPDDEKEKLTPARKKMLVEDWILTRLLAAEAEKRGLAEREDVKKELKDCRIKILSEELLVEESLKIEVTDEDVAGYFEAHRDLFTVPETVRLGVITLKTRDEAEAALKRVVEGEDFGEVASAVSIDKFKDRGGDAGILLKSDKLPEYLKAVFYLREGSLSDVVPCDQGYCILKPISKLPAKRPDFSELTPKVKESLQKRALREKRAEAILQLKEKLSKQVSVTRNLELLQE